jgi:hypothetical protein
LQELRAMTTLTAADLIRQEADLIVSGLALQVQLQEQGLDLLCAEMHALAQMLPGAPHPARSEAETEADFDNMPV